MVRRIAHLAIVAANRLAGYGYRSARHQRSQVADAARAQRLEAQGPVHDGYAESAASGEFLEKGMQIISKPFTMEKLAAKIAR
jgi:hypothetical protein